MTLKELFKKHDTDRLVQPYMRKIVQSAILDVIARMQSKMGFYPHEIQDIYDDYELETSIETEDEFQERINIEDGRD